MRLRGACLAICLCTLTVLAAAPHASIEAIPTITPVSNEWRRAADPWLSNSCRHSTAPWLWLLFFFAALLVPITGMGIAKLMIDPPPFVKRNWGLARHGSNLKIRGAPGSLLLRIVKFFFAPATVEFVFNPLVADWRDEYCAALNDKRPWKARWIGVRYRFSFLMAMGLSRAFSIVRKLAGK